jgi:hypothetical protein
MAARENYRYIIVYFYLDKKYIIVYLCEANKCHEMF